MHYVSPFQVVLKSASRAPFMVVAEVLDDPNNASTASAVAGTTRSASPIERDGDEGAEESAEEGSPGSVSVRRLGPGAAPRACATMALNDGGGGGGAASFVDALVARRVPLTTLGWPQQLACAAAVGCGFGELWSERVRRLQRCSPYGHLPGWRCVSFMVAALHCCLDWLLNFGASLAAASFLLNISIVSFCFSSSFFPNDNQFISSLLTTVFFK
jgi:hypothetical protein